MKYRKLENRIVQRFAPQSSSSFHKQRTFWSDIGTGQCSIFAIYTKLSEFMSFSKKKLYFILTRTILSLKSLRINIASRKCCMIIFNRHNRLSGRKEEACTSLRQFGHVVQTGFSSFAVEKQCQGKFTLSV